MHGKDIAIAWLIVFGSLALLMLLGGYVAVVQVSRQRIAMKRERMARQQAEHARQLIQQQLDAAEQTRQHVSRELHDNVGQLQALLATNLKAMRRMAMPEDVRRELDTQCGIVDRVLAESRQLARAIDARAWMAKGLAGMLREAFAAGSYARYRLELDIAEGLPELDPERSLMAYRVVQQALGNAMEHGDPVGLHIGLSASGNRLLLVVRDDGRGFDRNAPDFTPGMGLANLEGYANRLGGYLDILSVPGEGTAVMLAIPIEPNF